MTTENKPMFEDRNVEIGLWISKEMDEWLKETLQKLKKYKVKVTKSAFIRRAIGDKLYNLDAFFSLLEMADRKEGGVEIDE